MLAVPNSGKPILVVWMPAAEYTSRRHRLGTARSHDRPSHLPGRAPPGPPENPGQVKATQPGGRLRRALTRPTTSGTNHPARPRRPTNRPHSRLRSQRLQADEREVPRRVVVVTGRTPIHLAMPVPRIVPGQAFMRPAVRMNQQLDPAGLTI